MKYLTVEQLKTVNQRMIRATGGLYLAGEQNVVYPPSLESLVNFVQTRISLRPQPTVWEMAVPHVVRLGQAGPLQVGTARTGRGVALLLREAVRDVVEL